MICPISFRSRFKSLSTALPTLMGKVKHFCSDVQNVRKEVDINKQKMKSESEAIMNDVREKSVDWLAGTKIYNILTCLTYVICVITYIILFT